MIFKPTTPAILVLGGINMGLITRTERMPAPGETLRGDGFFSSPGGKGATQAVAAARHGAKVKMIGRVGDDVFGPTLLEALRSNGINVSDVSIDTESASGVGVIIVDNKGQNHILATYGANLRCDNDQLGALEAALPNYDVLLLQMEIPFDVSIQAAQTAKNYGTRVILDPAPAAPIPKTVFTLFDIIAPNQTEAEFHTGIVVNDVDSAAQAADILLELGVSTAVIKMAELGVFYRSRETEGFVPPFPVQAVDTTSAGDAFHGALAVALAEGKNIDDAVHYGAAAGALAVTRPGVQDSMPLRVEVEAML